MKQSKSGPENSNREVSKNTSELYKIIPTPTFLKEAKALEKKYPNIRMDFLDLAARLKKDPITGNHHVVKDVWKVRMPISDKGKGERGSGRVIIEVKIVDKEVYVLTVYDKSDIEDLTDKELKKLLQAPKPVRKRKK